MNENEHVDQFAETLPVSSDIPEPAGRFRIVRPLVRGGIGQIFLAVDEELKREVALKELLELSADDSDSRERFVWEAEITGRLEHPGIVPVYGLGFRTNGDPFYAMRLIYGETLRQTIRRFHARDWSDTRGGERLFQRNQMLRRFAYVCDTVHYAHTRGVIHRDIKPENIMLGPHGEALVVDWGMAKLIHADDKWSRPLDGRSLQWETRYVATHDGAFVGTPQYASPEQAAGRLDAVNAASDIYSLGATLFTILTDRPPIEKKELRILLHDVATGAFPKPTEINSSIPHPLEQICLTAMALRPQDRYATARELGEDIERFLSNESVRTNSSRQVHRLETAAIRVTVLSPSGVLFRSDAVSRPLELGRQQTDEELVYSINSSMDGDRLVIAGRSEPNISRKHAILAPSDDSRLKITNLGGRPLETTHGRSLDPNSEYVLTLPVELVFSNNPRCTVIVEASSTSISSPLVPDQVRPEDAADQLTSSRRTLPRGDRSMSDFASKAEVIRAYIYGAREIEKTSEWINTTLQSMQELLRLDYAAIVSLGSDNSHDWKIWAEAWPQSRPKPPSRYSVRVLLELKKAGQTFHSAPVDLWDVDQSMMGVDEVMASPILDRQNNVVGAFYGSRNANVIPGSYQVELEMLITEVVASMFRGVLPLG